MSAINIVPINTSIVKFTVQCASLQLFTSATFVVISYDANNNMIKKEPVSLSEEEYLAWQNNDEYIINLVAQKLGYTIESVPPEPVVPVEEPTP
jgi:hypothetical protein